MPLPEASFAEIAAWARGTADELRAAANVAEVWGAKVGSPSLACTTELLGGDAEIAGQVAELFRALVPHEQLVRDFLAGLDALPVADQRSAA